MRRESFGGSPAVSDGRLIVRSSKHLYCVTDKGETVKPSERVIAKTDANAGADRGENVAGQRGRPTAGAAATRVAAERAAIAGLTR